MFGAASNGPEYGSSTKTSTAAPATLPDERRNEGIVHDQVASGGVDDPHAVAHLRDRVLVDRAARLVGERQVQRDELRAGEHAFERRALHTELAEAVCADERVVRNHLHLEAERAPGDLPADPSKTEHAKRLVGELDAAPLRALPAAVDQRGMRLRDVPRQRHQEPDRVLRGRDDVRLRRVRDDDAATRGRVHVDVVDAHAGAADHLQARPGVDHVRGHLRRRPDDQSVVAADDLFERRLPVDVHLERLAKQLDPRLGDRFTDQDLHYATTCALVRLERARDRDAALDLRAQLGQRQLDRGQRRRDVEDVEPADVADAKDLALQVRLPRRECDAVPVAQVREQLVAVDPVRRPHRSDDGRAVVVGREELEPHRLDACARRATEPHVTLERSVEPVAEDEPEGDVEAADQRHRRSEGGVQLVLRLLVRLPVEVEAA